MGKVSFQKTSDNSIQVNIDEKHFTSFNYNTFEIANRPYFYPLFAPCGIQATRNYPMKKNVEGERQDHIHHTGVWTAWGKVNLVDNWAFGGMKGRQYVRNVSYESKGDTGEIVCDIDWTVPKLGFVQLQEKRTITIYGNDSPRMMDFEIELTAKKNVKFGDTKEGGFLSVRVPTPMDVPVGGRIENARGGISTDKDSEKNVWGKQAEWCDYSGEVEGHMIGLAILDHPSNINFPTHWHVRNYGLMTANPFGKSYFLGKSENGSFKLEKGESLTFKYRLVIHDGTPTEAKIKDIYSTFSE